MTDMRPDPSCFRRSWVLAVAVLAIVTGVLAAVAVVWPEEARRAGQTDPQQGVAPETPMDWLSVPPYTAALVICVVQLVRSGSRRRRRPLWVLLTLVVGFLLWRELPWDEQLLNDANTFSWAKYLGKPDVPLWAQIVLGGGSILVTALALVYVIRYARTIGRLAMEKVRCTSAWVCMAGLVMLALAQAFDKYASIDKHLGTNLMAWKATGWLGYGEESLELLGAVALLMACILAVREEPDEPSASTGERGGAVD